MIKLNWILETLIETLTLYVINNKCVLINIVIVYQIYILIDILLIWLLQPEWMKLFITISLWFLTTHDGNCE